MRFIYLLLILYAMPCYAQLPATTRDSLIKITCEILRTDQQYRTKSYQDSLKHNRENNPFLYRQMMTEWEQQDNYNFNTLTTIMKTYGYPEAKLLGPKACTILVILIHWSKQYPEWFNVPGTVAIFKKELDNGNLPLSRLDNAHFFYMRMNGDATDIRYKQLINNARLTYGLCPYDNGHFLTKEWIEPMRN